MRTKNYLSAIGNAIVLAMLPALAACTADSDATDSADAGGQPLRVFADRATTRVTNSGYDYTATFDKGDLVGIFIVKAGTDPDSIPTMTRQDGAWLVNKQFKYKDGELVPADGRQLRWPSPNELPAVDVYAYYPYQATNDIYRNYPKVTLAVNERQLYGNAAELVRAKLATLPHKSDINLPFKRALTLIEVTVRDDQLVGFDGMNAKMTVFGLTSVYTGSVLDPDDRVVANTLQANNGLQMQSLARPNNTHVFRCIVPPQTIIDHTPFLLISNQKGDKKMEFGKLGKNFDLPEGTHVNFNFTGQPEITPTLLITAEMIELFGEGQTHTYTDPTDSNPSGENPEVQ